jgi:putative transposase
LFKNNFFARNLHSQTAQAVMQKLKAAWQGYFALLARYREDKKHARANGQPFGQSLPKPPGYQPKDGHLAVKWKRQGFRLLDGKKKKLRMSLSKQTKEYLHQQHGIQSKFLWIALPKTLSLRAVRLQEIEIVPRELYGQLTFVLHIIYRKIINTPTIHHSRVLAIDLGVLNFASVVIEGCRKLPFLAKYCRGD